MTWIGWRRTPTRTTSFFLYVSSHGKYLREVLVWSEFFAAEDAYP